MTCFMHGLFALPVVWLSRKGIRYACVGLLTGMILHGLGNAPIILMHHEAFGISRTTWGILAQLWVILLVIIALASFTALHFGRRMLRRIWQARMICPGCSAVYRQPIFLGLNMGIWRYEHARCAAGGTG